MKNVTYTPEELDFFGLSPKDNFADYTPAEYFAVVNGSLAAGKMKDYTLAEIQEVENNLRQVYSTLSTPQMSTEQIVKCLDGPNETLINIVTLRQNKEQEQEKVLTSALTFLNEVIDEYDADAPENLARKYIGTVRNDLAAGKLDQYSLAQLQEVENNFKEAYSILSDEEKEFQSESCIQTIIDLTYLQNNSVEFIVQSLIEDYFVDSKKNPQSWGGFNPGKYKPSNKQSNAAKPQISEQLKDTVEYSLADLITADSQENYPEKRKKTIQKFSLKDNSAYEEEYSLGALLGKVIISPMVCTAFKAHCVVQPKQTSKKVSAGLAESVSLFSPSAFYLDASQGIVERYDLSLRLEELSKINVSRLPVAVNTPVVTVPTVPIPVAIQSSNSKFNNSNKSKFNSANTIANTLAKAAIVAAAGIASLIGYNFLSSSINAVDDHQLDYYHGSPSVEVVAPVNTAKTTGKYSESDHSGLSAVKSVGTGSKSVEQPAVASQAAPKAPHKTGVKQLSQLSTHSFDIYDSNIHSIQKGDTFAGLWKDYHARGGTLDFNDYLKSIRSANPLLENVNKIFPGQEVELPN
ncbi:hypothetical protein HY494_02335 [Candidatus Woesearchaeota archaeon]|nr:hypothetical protein [Candidatus Woesearchaeota archaeon]